jgi:hypothetical protein
MRQLAIGHDIGRVGKGWHPSPVFQARVPADVIGMQMRAHHIIDVVYSQASSRQTFFETIAVQHIPERARRSRLVVADTGIDENVVVGRLDYEALDAEHQPVLAIDKLRLQPLPVLVEGFFGQFREKAERIKKRALLFDNGVDCNLAKASAA